jgi:hypothetical protein
LSNATTIDSALSYIRSKQEQQLQHHHHHQQQYPSHAYTDMLLEETEKLYNKLAKELGDEIISDYAHRYNLIL